MALAASRMAVSSRDPGATATNAMICVRTEFLASGCVRSRPGGARAVVEREDVVDAVVDVGEGVADAGVEGRVRPAKGPRLGHGRRKTCGATTIVRAFRGSSLAVETSPAASAPVDEARSPSASLEAPKQCSDRELFDRSTRGACCHRTQEATSSGFIPWPTSETRPATG